MIFCKVKSMATNVGTVQSQCSKQFCVVLLYLDVTNNNKNNSVFVPCNNDYFPFRPKNKKKW